MLVFSNSAIAATAPISKGNVQSGDIINNKEKFTKETIEKSTYKADEEVRVIVEVEGAPAITYATKKGKKFSDLSESQKTNLQSDALKTQQAVKKDLANKKINVEYKESFTTVFNGFSGIVEFGQVDSIKKLPNVVNVTVANKYERPKQEPQMKYSKDLIEAKRTWDEYGYDGEGMIVGVIDTGVDPSHRDMVLTNPEEAALTEDDVANGDYPGTYFTEKVPYGYNYMDENDEILDLGPQATMHGMHVAGTVGANGDEENGGIKGVAPEAQILALKVFGNDPMMPSTWGDIYIKAIDDSIEMGADVLNMSLGSTAAFVDAESPEQQAIKRAVDNGVLMSISAGNSAHLGNGFFNPYTSNPDIGVVGAPGLSYDSLQVASIDNSHIELDGLTYSYGEETGESGYLSASSVHPHDVEQKTFELEYAALGAPEDFEGKDFDGKYALIQRGAYAFTEKALNAQAAGAAGVIIYNNTDGVVSMATDDAIIIPQLFMLKADGERLAEQLMNEVAVSIEFGEEKVTIENPTNGQMSAFTSWGVTPNLDFKPEITAPGGNIYSTFQDDQYGVMSGTSMAAPHVAGGAALMMQRVDEELNLENRDRVEMAKNILMNTSRPVVDKGAAQAILGQENPYSPRRQGSGIMQLHSAMSTPVVVTESETGEAKVALKEVEDQFSMTLTATNLSDEAVTYDVDANVQTDFAFLGLIGNAYKTFSLDELEAQGLVGAAVTINNGESTVEVPANGTATIEVDVDLSEATVYSEDAEGNAIAVSPNEIFENGYFVEGYVTLTDPTDENPQLSVPYVGFNGDWNAPPVLDELAYDDNNSFYEEAAMLYEAEDGYYYLGFDPISEGRYTDRIAISPNGDGEHDQIIPLLSYLRNAKSVEYNILDADKNALRKLKSENNVRKNYFDGGAGGALPYRLDPSIRWDGTIDGDVAEDGQYYLEIKTAIDYPGKEAQSLQVPVFVDTTPPSVEASLDGNMLSVTTEDAVSGVSYFSVLLDGEPLDEIYGPDTTEVGLDGSLISDDTEVAVVAFDNAANSVVHVVGDGEGPVIEVYTPETFEILNDNLVYVLGLVSDDTGVAEVTVEGQPVELEPFGGGEYLFEAEVEFEDGVHPINIKATDINGNTTSLANSRSIFVDSTGPTLEVEAPGYVGYDTTEVNLKSFISDNFEELRLKINDSEVFYHEMPGYEMNQYSTTVDTSVSLDPGENVFNLELTDLAGNVATKEVTIYRAESGENRVSRVSGESRYDTAVEVSSKGWDQADTVVLARGDDYADALAGVPLAKQHDAPLLLTHTDSLTAATKAEIERLGAKTVYLLGGKAAISGDVATELKELGVSVKRLSGKGRTETAAVIANEITGGQSSEVVLVNGFNFPDALSVASHAAEKGLPILLTKDDQLSQATEKALYDLNVNKTLVIGGTVAVSEAVFAELPNAYRVSGKDRYETAVAVANHFGVTTKHYNVTTGKDFPDALSAAALAAKEGTGIVLVGSDVPQSVHDFVSEHGFDTLSIIGGTVAIDTEIEHELNELLK